LKSANNNRNRALCHREHYNITIVYFSLSSLSLSSWRLSRSNRSLSCRRKSRSSLSRRNSCRSRSTDVMETRVIRDAGAGGTWRAVTILSCCRRCLLISLRERTSVRRWVNRPRPTAPATPLIGERDTRRIGGSLRMRSASELTFTRRLIPPLLSMTTFLFPAGTKQQVESKLNRQRHRAIVWRHLPVSAASLARRLAASSSRRVSRVLIGLRRSVWRLQRQKTMGIVEIAAG